MKLYKINYYLECSVIILKIAFATCKMKVCRVEFSLQRTQKAVDSTWSGQDYTSLIYCAYFNVFYKNLDQRNFRQ